MNTYGFVKSAAENTTWTKSHWARGDYRIVRTDGYTYTSPEYDGDYLYIPEEKIRIPPEYQLLYVYDILTGSDGNQVEWWMPISTPDEYKSKHGIFFKSFAAAAQYAAEIEAEELEEVAL